MKGRSEFAVAPDPSTISEIDPKLEEYDPSSIVINGNIYPVDELSRTHPGGELFVKIFAGKDATNAFLSYHRRPFPSGKYEDMRKHTTIHHDSSLNRISYDQNYLDLCREVNKILPIHKSFAPTSYYVKIVFLLSSALGIEYYMHYYVAYYWQLVSILGVLYALIGLNVQHDANHGAISSKYWVNRLLGLTQNWIGGSSISWIHKHVVQHHIHTNDIHMDPDISGIKLFRLNPSRNLCVAYSFQYIYFFLFIGLYGWTATMYSMIDVWHGKNYTPMSPYLVNQRNFDLLCSILFLSRWIILPIYQTSTVYVMVNISPLMILAGYYLSFFFILSHNFTGTEFWKDSEKGFLYCQIASSSNVGGKWLCFLNGGLNYQIEHHLFPRINHTYYPRISPIVRKFCYERNIPYTHYDTITENLYSTINHLYCLGKKE